MAPRAKEPLASKGKKRAAAVEDHAETAAVGQPKRRARAKQTVPQEGRAWSLAAGSADEPAGDPADGGKASAREPSDGGNACGEPTQPKGAIEALVSDEALNPLLAFLGPVGDSLKALPADMLGDIPQEINAWDGTMKPLCETATKAVHAIARHKSFKREPGDAFMSLQAWQALGYTEEEVKASASKWAKPAHYLCDYREMAYTHYKHKLACQLEEYASDPRKYHARLEKATQARLAELQREGVAEARARERELKKAELARKKRAAGLLRKIQSHMDDYSQLDLQALKPNRAQYLAALGEEMRCVFTELDKYVKNASDFDCGEGKFVEWETCIDELDTNLHPIGKKATKK